MRDQSHMVKKSANKAAANPFGLGARPLKKIIESLEDGWFERASDIYEAHTGADAPPFAELVLWQALRAGGKPELGWFEHMPPATSPVQCRAILGRLHFEDQARTASGHVFETMVQVLHDALEIDAEAVRGLVAARRDHSTRLDALDDDAADALPREDGTRAFRLVPVDVPESVFDAPDAPLRQLLVNLPGYALGDAIVIQEEPDMSSAFMMQLDDSFGINLGDCGRLYVYRDGATADCA